MSAEQISSRIDSSHLKNKYLKRFKKIENDVISSYKLAIDALVDKSVISYVPTLHITPFVVVKEFIFQGGQYRQTYYGFTFLDSDDFARFAIYPPLDFLEKFPGRIAAHLGHEIAHVISFQGRMNLTKENIKSVLENRLKYENTKEHDMEDELKAFNPEFRKIVFEWNRLSRIRFTKDMLLKDAWCLSVDQAQQYMFRERYKELGHYMTSKLAKVLDLNFK